MSERSGDPLGVHRRFQFCRSLMTHRIGRRRSADPVTDGCEVLIQTGGTALDRDLLRVTEDRSECRASLRVLIDQQVPERLPRPMPSCTFAPGMRTMSRPRSSLPTSTPFSISAGLHPVAQSTATAGFWVRVAASNTRPCQPGARGRVARLVLRFCVCAGRSAASTDLTARAASIARRTCAIDPAMSPTVAPYQPRASRPAMPVPRPM